MKKLMLFCMVCIFIHCTSSSVKNTSQREETIPSAPLNKGQTLQKIAFGSCNKTKLDQPMWSVIDQHDPNLWIWLGDIIYADTEDMGEMKNLYQKQKNQSAYRQFRSKYPVIGIWDDHDYGENDGDQFYTKKVESKSLLLDFLDVPTTAPVRDREGAYQSYEFGKVPNNIKVILLDTRYFRDELEKNYSRSSRYHPNLEGEILGAAQWKWLTSELANSTAALNIIASSIQVIPAEHAYEKWANFPKERQRLFDLLQKIKPNPTLLISGDRHIAEVSKIDLPDLHYPLYEITSSGLTHSYEAAGDEINRYRIGQLSGKKNFGLLAIDWTDSKIKVNIEIRGVNNELIIQQSIF